MACFGNVHSKIEVTGDPVSEELPQRLESLHWQIHFQVAT